MRIVIALGGNALGNSPQEQLALVKKTAKAIVDIIDEGHEIIIAHGNGPQVGMINLAMEQVNMPFPECGAMSQGYIGYHLQNALKNELNERKSDRNVIALITQVEVDLKDQAFDHPTKPIGAFVSKEEAEVLSKQKGFTYIEDSGRGYRRVVASPKPIDIVEKKVIQDSIESGHIVISCGGGGIPVVNEAGKYRGVAAVIDKDFASSKLAELVDADMLCILTAVDYVSLHFNTAAQVDLKTITATRLSKHIQEGHFAKGSMLPKVEAALHFVTRKKARRAVIGNLEKALEAIKGNQGTIIINEEEEV